MKRIPNAPAGLRERQRANGSTRIWWEPSAAARQLGFSPVELDEANLGAARRQAEKLNLELARAQRSGKREAPAARGRTIEALIAAYKKSLAYTDLAPATQRSYEAHFRLIIRKWGTRQVREFTKPVMRTWYEAIHTNTGASMAVAQLRAMSLLFAHAELIGWRPEGSNPCHRLRMKTPQPRARAASWGEIDALVTMADDMGLASIGTAILLSLLQGQRQTDVIMACCGDFQSQLALVDGQPRERIMWQFVRSKRGNAGALWLHPDVEPRIAAILDTAPDDGRRLIRDEETGADYHTDLFIRRWRKVRDAVIAADKSGGRRGLADLQFRDLRRTFGILSRAGGATRDDTADVLGNSAATNPRLARTYMPGQLDTASRAVEAIRRPAKKAGKPA